MHSFSLSLSLIAFLSTFPSHFVHSLVYCLPAPENSFRLCLQPPPPACCLAQAHPQRVLTKRSKRCMHVQLVPMIFPGASCNPTSSTKPSLPPPPSCPLLRPRAVLYPEAQLRVHGHLRRWRKRRGLKEPQKLGLNPARRRQQQQRGRSGKLPPCSAPQLLACRTETNAHLLGSRPLSLFLLPGTHVTRTECCSHRELKPCLPND